MFYSARKIDTRKPAERIMVWLPITFWQVIKDELSQLCRIFLAFNTLSRAETLYPLILKKLSSLTTYNQHLAAVTLNIILLISEQVEGYSRCYEILSSENSRILLVITETIHAASNSNNVSYLSMPRKINPFCNAFCSIYTDPKFICLGIYPILDSLIFEDIHTLGYRLRSLKLLLPLDQTDWKGDGTHL